MRSWRRCPTLTPIPSMRSKQQGTVYQITESLVNLPLGVVVGAQTVNRCLYVGPSNSKGTIDGCNTRHCHSLVASGRTRYVKSPSYLCVVSYVCGSIKQDAIVVGKPSRYGSKGVPYSGIVRYVGPWKFQLGCLNNAPALDTTIGLECQCRDRWQCQFCLHSAPIEGWTAVSTRCNDWSQRSSVPSLVLSSQACCCCQWSLQ